MAVAVRGRAAVAAAVTLALAMGGCDAGSHDESLAGYAMLFAMMFVGAAAVGLVVATVGLVAACGGVVTLGLNTLQPSGWSRAAGVAVGYANVGVGVVGTALLFFLATSHRAHGAVVQLHAPSVQSTVVVVAFVALGLANLAAAISPGLFARAPTARRAAAPGR